MEVKDPVLQRRVDYVKECVSMAQLFHFLEFPIHEGERERNACCPFHNEAHPSARVFLDQNTFYCWACSKGGDVIWIVQETFGLSFVKAVEWLEKTFDCAYSHQDYEKRFSRSLKRAQKLAPVISPEDYWNQRHKALVNGIWKVERGKVERVILNSAMGPVWDYLDDLYYDVRFGVAGLEVVRSSFDRAANFLRLIPTGDFIKETILTTNMIEVLECQ